MRVILLGNARAGKSAMARQLARSQSIPWLSLDEITWAEGAERLPLEESAQALRAFLDSNERWVIEGCYSDLIELALPFCDELRFLNPGIEVCVAHCLKRPWEPEKFSSEKEQKETLANLIAWVQEYETRADECGLKRHRRLFESFSGKKREYKSIDEYIEG
ncbi:MAG: shikimate kinase [Chloracidobacterium sp. CP2_5A]|nr:MAG: shikimate kinase [Chloracidobacterium sp. CP2_5A]